MNKSPEGDLYLRNDIAEHWAGQEPFAAAFAVKGEVFRQLEQRQTQAFTLSDKRYFIKCHQGATWKEILKNLLQLRLPVVSARNEFLAIQHLQQLGIKVPLVAAYGRRGWWPSQLQSFLVTEDVGPHVSLEDYCRPWQQQPPTFAHKQRLLSQIASTARTMHRSGLCHRDFYLCHLLLRESDGALIVIDLHRALIKKNLSARWRIKDLAGLYFSAMECGLSKRDLLRFVRSYGQHELRHELQKNANFWRQVQRRAVVLYQKHSS
jgi:heptose I phosphotransferase